MLQLVDETAALDQFLAAQRAQTARLKGLKGPPSIKPSGLEQTSVAKRRPAGASSAVAAASRSAVSRSMCAPIRFVVTNNDRDTAEWVYDLLCCGQGQAKNLVELHETPLAFDRASRRSAIANRAPLALRAAA